MDLDSEDRTLYIGNLDKNVTEEVLYELFLQAGPIERVKIQNNKNSFGYGFITYKHEVTVDYAIDLYKGTKLFKRELLIKRKGDRSNSSRPTKYKDSNQPYDSVSSGFQDVIQEKLSNFRQAFSQHTYHGSQALINFTSNSLKGSWSSRNKPYDHGSRNHYPRSQDSRERHKHRDYVNKSYHGRKNRY